MIAGWDQFDLDFFVSAPKTSAIDSSHHKMVVFDTRQVPGDTAAFPAVSYCYSHRENVQKFRKQHSAAFSLRLLVSFSVWAQSIKN